MLCLVNEVKEQMQGALLDVLYKRDDSGNMSVENLLEEDADYTRQKKRCQEFLHLVRIYRRHLQHCCTATRLLALVVASVYGRFARLSAHVLLVVAQLGDAAGVVREVQDFRG